MITNRNLAHTGADYTEGCLLRCNARQKVALSQPHIVQTGITDDAP